MALQSQKGTRSASSLSASVGRYWRGTDKFLVIIGDVRLHNKCIGGYVIFMRFTNTFLNLSPSAHDEAFNKARVLHHDISVGNILITCGQGMLIDWDLSKQIDSREANRV
jgi:hypothetical protein